MCNLIFFDISLYFQDFVDMAYVMQKRVFPHCEELKKHKIHYSKRTKFTGVQEEYDRIVRFLLSGNADFYVFNRLGTKNDRERKALFFACHAVDQMKFFSKPPNGYDVMNPNLMDLSMSTRLPEDRDKKAVEQLKKIFSINEFGTLIYLPEMNQKNYFSIFRDRRPYVNSLSHSNENDNE